MALTDRNYLQSPYLLMTAVLYDLHIDRPVHEKQDNLITGTSASSLHRLKDVDNSDGAFFVFGDLSVKVEGEFRLCFTLYEIDTEAEAGTDRYIHTIKQIISRPFTVYPAKTFPGMAESTFLSRSFGDQGVRLRIRKEARATLK